MMRNFPRVRCLKMHRKPLTMSAGALDISLFSSGGAGPAYEKTPHRNAYRKRLTMSIGVCGIASGPGKAFRDGQVGVHHAPRGTGKSIVGGLR
jgi:hypothetical protein